jgi:hypothetical protein
MTALVQAASGLVSLRVDAKFFEIFYTSSHLFDEPRLLGI